MSDSQPIRHRSASSQVAESLVMEIVQQGRVIQEQQERRRQEEILASGAVDYRCNISYILHSLFAFTEKVQEMILWDRCLYISE